MSKQLIDLPKLSDSKEYVIAKEKLTELRLQLVEAERKRDAILSDINTPRPLERNPIKEAAQRMLDGEADAVTPAMSKQLWESFNEMMTRIKVIRVAIKMQEKIVDELRSAASFKAMERITPIHRENVRLVVAKLKELDAALMVEADLRDYLFQQDFACSQIRHMGINALGMLRNSDSRASLYMMEAFREGFITSSELPENLQKLIPPAPGAKPRLMKAVKAMHDDWTATA